MLANRFIFLVLLVTLVEIIFVAFDPTGLNVFKVGLTAVLWSCALVTLIDFIINFKIIRFAFDKVGFFLIMTFIVICILNLFRGFIGQSNILTTIGNRYTSLPLFLPFTLVYVVNTQSIQFLRLYLFRIGVIGAVFFALFYLYHFQTGIKEDHKIIYTIFFSLSSGTIFLYPNFLNFNFFKKTIFIFLIIFLFILSIVVESRTMFLRLLILSTLTFLLFAFNNKLFKFGILFSCFIPLIFIISCLNLDDYKVDFNLNNSIFFNYMSIDLKDGGDKMTDTRSFLYLEVINDLTDSDNLLIGKGPGGSYYSSYFDTTGDDAPDRYTVEVGFLALLLKFGLLGTFIYMFILVYAIYRSVIKSNIKFVNIIGVVLFTYFILLFVENLYLYNHINLLVWYFIGISMLDIEHFNPKIFIKS